MLGIGIVMLRGANVHRNAWSGSGYIGSGGKSLWHLKIFHSRRSSNINGFYLITCLKIEFLSKCDCDCRESRPRGGWGGAEAERAGGPAGNFMCAIT